MRWVWLALAALLLAGCSGEVSADETTASTSPEAASAELAPEPTTPVILPKTPRESRNLTAEAIAAKDTLHVHLFVALCDNDSQGIVPVSRALGDGDSPKTNLYWGAAFGVKTYLPKRGWTIVHTEAFGDPVLERLVLEQTIDGKRVRILADAYRGREIRQAVADFLQASAGQLETEIKVGEETLAFGGQADLVAYAGHDGLMEFDIRPAPTVSPGGGRDAIVLACISKDYFKPYLKKAGAYPLVWTTGFMAPEAYTLDGAIKAWARGGSDTDIAHAAAAEYHRLQKCGESAARGLLVSGW